MASLILEQTYLEGKWILEELNLSEKEVFDSLTPELYDLTPVIYIEKFLHEKGMLYIQYLIKTRPDHNRDT